MIEALLTYDWSFGLSARDWYLIGGFFVCAVIALIGES